jgi:uncharacterized protein
MFYQFGRKTNSMAAKAQDQEFLELIAKNVVANPNDVKVTRTIDERGVLLTLDINPADMGYIIGRRGQTAQAIRTLLKIVGAKNNARVNLKINEPEGAQRRVRKSDDIDTSSVDDLKI